MPVTAMLVIEGDPEKASLDAIADRVARGVYGTDFAAASRWCGALGGSYLDRDPRTGAPLPASAFSGGPVHDGADRETDAMLAADEARMEMEREPGATEADMLRAELDAADRTMMLPFPQEGGAS